MDIRIGNLHKIIYQIEIFFSFMKTNEFICGKNGSFQSLVGQVWQCRNVLQRLPLPDSFPSSSTFPERPPTANCSEHKGVQSRTYSLKYSNYEEDKLLDQRSDRDALLLQTRSSR